MIRKRKKTRKKRGHENHSGLRRRGAGNRGGRGNAGQGKKGDHKRTKMLAKGKRLGKYGFKNPRKKKLKSINLDDLMKHVKNKEVNAKELGYDRVLGRGRALKDVTVKADYFSKSAKNKIEEVNGKAVVM